MMFGLVVCLDSFLYSFTILPIRFCFAFYHYVSHAIRNCRILISGEGRSLHTPNVDMIATSHKKNFLIDLPDWNLHKNVIYSRGCLWWLLASLYHCLIHPACTISSVAKPCSNYTLCLMYWRFLTSFVARWESIYWMLYFPKPRWQIPITNWEVLPMLKDNLDPSRFSLWQQAIWVYLPCIYERT